MTHPGSALRRNVVQVSLKLSVLEEDSSIQGHNIQFGDEFIFAQVGSI